MSAFSKSAPVPTLGESYEMGFERGQIIERKRIIELIESEDWSGLSLAEDKENLIALIKGEK